MKRFLLLLLLHGGFAAAQAPALFFEKLTAQNGLSHNKVNCILQDRRGFLWLGTEDGLNRYDGKSFVHFRSRAADTTTLSGNIITALLEDDEGLLWIGTADGGLNRYDYRLPPPQQFRQYKHIPGLPTSIPTNGITTLLAGDRDYLWLGTRGASVIRFNKITERFDDPTKSPKSVLALCRDGAGNLWAGREGGGLLKLNATTLSVSEDPRYRDLYAKLPHAVVTALYRDKTGSIWFGSWDKVLYRQNANSGAEEAFKNGAGSFTADEIQSFAEDDQGRLWMGGKEAGLQVFDPATNRFYNFRNDPSREGTIAANRINCIYRDRQGRMWLGTDRGVCLSTPHGRRFTQTFLPHAADKNLTVYRFFEDEDGTLWIGTSEGLFHREADGKLTHRPLFYNGQPLQVTSFLKKDESQLYLGTDYSLFVYNKISNRLSLLPNTDKDKVMNRLIESRIVSIVADSIDGRPVLLAAPYGHYLAYYDLQRQQWISRLHPQNIVQAFNLKDNLIRRIYQTKSGAVWMATAKEGLMQWTHHSQPKAAFFSHNPSAPGSIGNNNVYDLAEGEKGALWVSTYGGGLYSFDTAMHWFTHISASDNLIEGVQVDAYQNVWMITNGQLAKYDPRRRLYSSFRLPDLEKSGGVNGQIFKDRSGRLYVAGSNYFISFSPDSVGEAAEEVTVYLTDFQLFNQSFSHLLAQRQIALRYNDNYFAFEFAAPDLTPGHNVRYAYKLEGFDKDWVEAGGRNYVSYSNLAGGDYAFRVKATTTPGSWSRHEASIALTVIPPYWKQPLFYALCAVLLALGVYLVYNYRINELLKRQAIRNRIAQDLHDNVGSTLSSISVYSQVAQIYQQKEQATDLRNTLEKISATSSEMISELNDTVWAINPHNDNMEVMLQRMESFARPLLAAQNIRFHFDYDASLPLLNLDMEKRKNFFAVFKEAVNNAVKYSGCENVSVTVRHKAHRLFLSIADDGKGFDLSKTGEGYKSSVAAGGGNGLQNMQQRAAAVKGSLGLRSQPGKGTVVELQFPIP